MKISAWILMMLAAASPARALSVAEYYRKIESIERAAEAGGKTEALRLLSALEQPSPVTRAETLSALLRSAGVRSRLGDYPGAESDLRAVLAIEPRNFDALCVLTQFLRERNKLAKSLEAANILAQVVEGIPEKNRAEKWLQRGETYMRLERFDEAEADIARALREKPDDVPSLWLMTQALMRRGDPRRALAFATRMTAASSPGIERAQALAQRGQVREALADAAGADADMIAALKESPTEHVALEARMQRLRAQNRLTQALTLSDDMIAASASAPPTRRAILFEQRAYTRRLSGDAKGAETDLHEALRAEPDSAVSLRSLAELLLEVARAPDALEPADRLVRVMSGATGSGRADAFVLRARILDALGRTGDAASDLNRASLAAPDSPVVLKARARAARAAGDASGALALSTRLLEVSSAAPAGARVEALIERALALADLGRKPEAERDLESAERLSTGPAASRVLDATAGMLLSLGKPERALAYAERLVTASSATSAGERAAALTRRAEAFESLGRKGAASNDLAAAAALSSHPGRETQALIDALLRVDRPDLALPLADRLAASVEGGPPEERSAALERRARVLETVGRMDEALSDLCAASKAAPARRAPLLRKARLLAKLGRKAEAMVATDALVALSTGTAHADAAEAFAWRAELRSEEADNAGAESDHAAAEAALPGYHARAPDAAVRWARVVSRRSRPEALVLLARLRASSPAGGSDRSALAAAEAEARWSDGDAAGAAVLMTGALRLDAKAACVGTPLLADRSAAAAGYFDACVSRFPKDAVLRTDRGVARWSRGARKEALADFRAALSAEPGSLPAALSLAAGLESTGRKDEAVTVLRTVLQHAEPSAEAAATARRELERLTKL